MILDRKICQKARLSRDARFDGKFFTAVKTTGIYCRSICPVSPPKEENVSYFDSAIECAQAGYRPCLRCRPDSAPNSPAWKGVNATLDRALALIDQGCLQEHSLAYLAERLGISDRYLRQLFKRHLGTSAKNYALYQQCLFAKHLLHQTKLPITEIALASGFDSVRRFNDCFKKQLQLTPSQLRKSTQASDNKITVKLYYQPPYNWPVMQATLAARAIDKLEWCTKESYGRSFTWQNSHGYFTATHLAEQNCFEVNIVISEISQLKAVTHNIKRILDLNADLQHIESDLKHCLPSTFTFNSGIRLPGIWQLFEAGVRAILGQQISVAAARTLVSQLVDNLGEPYGDMRLFPSPHAIANSDLAFFKMPQARKNTLKNLANFYLEHQDNSEPQQWLALKGIGPWTVNYAQMRGLSDPDIFLGADLGVKKALAQSHHEFSPEQAAPWRSYLTFQLWSQL
ncbi:DNA-3-methyladenine glycosylase 2 family protein [Litorilituus sediminis]|uniref:DNA-3-methyladenine glycosylase II n=1 Tax=Litorilituus sediminis TaxID=718192 RepID=A0A4P6P4N3_9GAMM|nr:AlkA N-terminal domain-containing protein [Litorilituus sediminis]QBG36511.1 DNA-3-methyladenine glycosylase 2 family protein [Litorilituus sediminis]